MFESQRDHHSKNLPDQFCSHRLARSRTSPFHGGNRGSNPLGSTKFILKPFFGKAFLFSVS